MNFLVTIDYCNDGGLHDITRYIFNEAYDAFNFARSAMINSINRCEIEITFTDAKEGYYHEE